MTKEEKTQVRKKRTSSPKTKKAEKSGGEKTKENTHTRSTPGQSFPIAGINNIFEAVFTQATYQEFGEVCLAVAEAITGSAVSFIGEVGGDGLLHDIAISTAGWKDCAMYDRESRRKLQGDFHTHGLYGSVLREGKPLIVNDPASHPDRIGLPKGHPPLTSFLGVPIKERGNTVGIVAGANRIGGYSYEEQRALEMLAPVIGLALTRRRTEKALRESEERLKIVIDGGRIGTWDHDLMTNEINWNPFLYQLLSRDPDGPAITGETFFEYIHPEDRERINLHLAATLKAGDEFIDEFRIIRDDGEVRWLASSGHVYHDPSGRPIRMAGVNYDITDRKLMEEKLRRSREDLEKRVRERTEELNQKIKETEELNAELIREIDTRKQFEADLKIQGKKLLASYNQRAFLSRLMVDLLEKERREIGNSLHEEIGQIMSGVMLQLEKLKSSPPVDGPTLDEQVSAIQDVLRGAVKKTRNISRSLRSDVLERYGLIPALEELINETQRASNIQIQFFTKNIPKNLRQHRALVVYRIVQESLTNILRYSGTQEVSINLVQKGDMLLLTIEDSGVGFDYDAVIRKSGQGKGPLGLIIMRERVAQLGGNLYIESAPGRGTHILAEIPFDAEQPVSSEMQVDSNQ